MVIINEFIQLLQDNITMPLLVAATFSIIMADIKKRLDDNIKEHKRNEIIVFRRLGNYAVCEFFDFCLGYIAAAAVAAFIMSGIFFLYLMFSKMIASLP